MKGGLLSSHFGDLKRCGEDFVGQSTDRRTQANRSLFVGIKNQQKGHLRKL